MRGSVISSWMREPALLGSGWPISRRDGSLVLISRRKRKKGAAQRHMAAHCIDSQRASALERRRSGQAFSPNKCRYSPAGRARRRRVFDDRRQRLAIRRALEAAGVDFIDENGGGPGVRLRQRRRLQTLSYEEHLDTRLAGTKVH